MTEDEKRISDIAARVKTSGGRISQDDLDYLLASLTSWKLVAKHNGALASLTPTEQAATLEKALEATTADWLKALDEIDRLKGTSGTAH